MVLMGARANNRVTSEMRRNGRRGHQAEPNGQISLQEEFQALVDEAHADPSLKSLQLLLQNRDDREDLTQEIISLRCFDERRRFSAWMYPIALNIAISSCRRGNRVKFESKKRSAHGGIRC
jgi:DNA-directed RNA polymerase specialized sigma24 family protein